MTGHGGMFAGKDVVVITDNDAPGEKYGADIAADLTAFAKSVHVVPAAGIAGYTGVKLKDGGDITDVFETVKTDMQGLKEFIGDIGENGIGSLRYADSNETVKYFSADKLAEAYERELDSLGVTGAVRYEGVEDKDLRHRLNGITLGAMDCDERQEAYEADRKIDIERETDDFER